MKKNITINLCGRLFNIDEDAYELLRHYTETLRNYFGKQQGGSEIADDIEERIAELLDELKRQGVEAVNIEHVKQVITRIGQPEEMDGSEPDDSPGPQSTDSHETDGEKTAFQGDETGNGHHYSSFKSFFSDVKELFRERRFYRNPKDKMIAGVLSGLASAFEIDVTLLRLLVIAGVVVLSMLGSVFGFHDGIVFFNARVFLTFAVIYVIMAIIMPEAETPEQQLKMQGKPVNMQNLAEEVVQNVSETAEMVEKKDGCLKTAFNGILKFLGSCFKIVMIVLAIGLFFGGVCLLLWALFALHTPEQASQFFQWDIVAFTDGYRHIFIIFIVALLTTLFIPAYAIVQHLIRPLKVWQRLLLVLVWMAALATSIVTGTVLSEIYWKYDVEKQQTDAVSRHAFIETEEGIKMKLHEKEFLDKHGWRILNGEGCNDRFTAYGEYYLANRRNNRYLDCYDDRHRQRYRAENGTSLMPGRYKLTCAARANGRGAFVYTLINGKKQLIEIPATGNTGGSIWQEATVLLKEVVDSLNHMPVASEKLQQELGFHREITRANNGKGYGWNRIEFGPIVVTKPHTMVNYGVTTDPDFTGQTWLGEWFSACDFIIEKISE
ncbi:MAG: PspC domain-containing protein [Prevotella sp.]|nr:PspC domain-containing protein [Prevotella sp.]